MKPKTMSSNIVPFYSSSPPPLDDQSIGNDDDDDDDFGNFSSAPSAVNYQSMVKNANDGNSDESDFNPFVFRPISPSEPGQEINTFTSAAKDSIDQVTRHAPKTGENSLKKEEKHWHMERNETEADEKGSAESLYGDPSKGNHTPLKENSDICDLKDSGLNLSSPITVDSVLPSANDLLSETCHKIADIESSNEENLSGNSVQGAVHENDSSKNEFKLGGQNVVDEDFKDFESADLSAAHCQLNDSRNLEVNVSDNFFITKGSDDFELRCNQEFDEFQSSEASDDKLSLTEGTDKETDSDSPQTEAATYLPEPQVKRGSLQEYDAGEDEFAEFDDFQIDSDDVAKPVLVSRADDPPKMLEDQIDQELACDALDHRKVSVEEQLDSPDDFNDFEEFKNVSGNLPLTEDKSNNNFDEKNLVMEAVTETLSDTITPMVGEYEGEKLGYDGDDDFGDFDDFQFSSDKALDSNSVATVLSEDNKEIQPAILVTQDFHVTNTDAEVEDIDDFHVTSNVDSPSSNIRTMSLAGTGDAKAGDTKSSWSAFNLSSGKTDDGSWANFAMDSHKTDLVKGENVNGKSESNVKSSIGLEASNNAEPIENLSAKGPQVKMETLMSRVMTNCYPIGKRTNCTEFELLTDVIIQQQKIQFSGDEMRSASLNAQGTDSVASESKSNLSDICVWNNLKSMDLTAAFSFQWHTSSVSRNLLTAINIDTSSILLGHKKQQNPLFAPNLGLLEPMKAPTESQNLSTDKDQLSFLTSDCSTSSLTTASTTFTPQDVPQFEFDWGGSGLTNPLDATEKERELLDALEPASDESSVKMSPMSLETMLATLLPSIPSTQLIPKSQNVDRKQLSEEAVRVLAKLPDLSFMHANVLMFPLKDTITN